MKKDSEVESYLLKLEKISSYWMKHNSEHADEHQKWMEDAKKLGLTEVVNELEEVIGLLKKANGHIASIKEITNK